jgi:acyl dehydratase
VVKVRSDAFNQDGVLVATFRRSVLVPRQSVGSPEEAA